MSASKSAADVVSAVYISTKATVPALAPPAANCVACPATWPELMLLRFAVGLLLGCRECVALAIGELQQEQDACVVLPMAWICVLLLWKTLLAGGRTATVLAGVPLAENTERNVDWTWKKSAGFLLSNAHGWLCVLVT
jgi:hypothetical protein